MKHLQLLLLLLLSNVGFTQHPECGDLLEQYVPHLNKAEFIDCTSGIGQTILEANYNVLGKDSEEIEEFLISEFGMGKLEFKCCGWEPANGKNAYLEHAQLKTLNPNYVLEISMYASAEKKNEKGETEIEPDRKNVDFHLKVRIMVI